MTADKQLQDDLIAWEQMSKQLAALRAQEMALRQSIFARAFPGAKEGTNTLALANSYALKGVRKLNYKVDTAALPGVLESLREDNPGIEDRVINYRPELRTGEYKKLPEAVQHALQDALTISDAAPTLSIVEVKKK